MRASLRQEDPDYLFWDNEEWEIVDIDEGKQLVCPRCARRRKRKVTTPRRWSHRGHVAHFSVQDAGLQLDWLDTTDRYPPRPDTPEVRRAYDLPIHIPYTGFILVCQHPTQNYSGNYDSGQPALPYSAPWPRWPLVGLCRSNSRARMATTTRLVPTAQMTLRCSAGTPTSTPMT